MVGDAAHPGAGLLLGLVLNAEEVRGRRDDLLEGVGVEVRHDALHDRGDPLEAHAGVDVLLGEGLEDASVLAVELREDEVPDLGVAAAGTGGLAVLLSAPAVTIEVDLAARSARPVGALGGGARGPEVVGLAVAPDARLGDLHVVAPRRVGLVVVLVDGDGELRSVDLHLLSQELPRPGDGLLLEVVAEGEVAEHLEKRLVGVGLADLLDVAGSNALLGRGGALEGVLPLP